jgi:hypothetical protein
MTKEIPMNEIDRELIDKLISPNDLTNAEMTEDGVPVVVKDAAKTLAKLWVKYLISELDRDDIGAVFDSSALCVEWMREQHEVIAALRDERDRAVRCLREIMGWADWGDYAFAMHEYLDAENFAPGDFDWLRQLIESEEGQ